MDNTDMQQAPSFWSAVFTGATVGAIIAALTGIVGVYITMSSEPTGSFFNLTQILGIVGCLIASVGGYLANRKYAGDNELTYPIGKGALIGLYTGLMMAIIATLIGLLWQYVIDPSYLSNLLEWSRTNIDMMQIPDASKEAAYAQLDTAESPTAMLKQTGITAVIYSIVNVISGIIGAKLHASEE